MTQNGLSHYTLDSCTLQLNNWKPFLSSAEYPNSVSEAAAVACSDSLLKQKPIYLNGLMEILGAKSENQVHVATGGSVKKQCLSDRGSRRNLCDFLDMSKLSLLEDDSKSPQSKPLRIEKTSTIDRIYHRSIPLMPCAHMARKRRRRGSRSGSGRSSDISRNRINGSDPPTRCASATYATCSDFPIAGTDSSGELFYNGDCNWGSDIIIPMSEVRNYTKREGKDVGGEPLFSWQGIDIQSNESGYGSEPGYRGDGEFGYGEDGAGDELDEEEDDGRITFWDNLVVCDSVLGNVEQPNFDMSEGDDRSVLEDHMQLVCKNALQDQRLHHRFRRRRQDCRMMESNDSRDLFAAQNN